MANMAIEEKEGWNPLLDQRVFRSANQAWEIYGQYRFDISPRTFQTFIGKEKDCPPRPDGKLYVEDIEIFATSRGWPPAPSFVVWRPLQGGGGGSDSDPRNDWGAVFQREKALKAQLDREEAQIEMDKKRKALIPVKEYEQRLAAAAAIVGNEAEAFVYDNVREIIFMCAGNPEKEDSLREYLLEKVRRWLHAFSAPQEYELEYVDEEHEGGGA